MESLLQPENWASLFTLTAMETVLGIDNVIFLSILASKLPANEQKKARQLGLALALVIRLGLLFAIQWIMGLTEPLFEVAHWEFSGRSLILLGGGLFLIGKTTFEIYEKLEVEEHSPESGPAAGRRAGFMSTLVQILLLDIVFSLDSVITAVGMAKHLPIMAAAMVVSTGIMLLSARSISDFVNRHPSVKILALSFLLLIGVMLVAEGFGEHVNKAYIYVAMVFSLVVELLNMRFRKNHKPVQLHTGAEKNPGIVA